MFKQPSYVATRCNKVLLKGEYKGYEYRIMDLGTHPTAYVKLPKRHPLYKRDWEKIEGIEVHGGLTYSRNYLTCEADHLDGWWIGWDYAHYRDHMGYDPETVGKRWTTEEILYDVTSVIDQCLGVKK